MQSAAQAERVQESQQTAERNAAAVMRLAAKAGLKAHDVNSTSGLTHGLSMTGLLLSASHSQFDEWMHWMLKDRGQNFKRYSGGGGGSGGGRDTPTSPQHDRRRRGGGASSSRPQSAAGTLNQADIAYAMHMFYEEEHLVAAGAKDDDPSTNLVVETPRQRLLEQALKSRAHSELDRMLLSAWKGPVDDALDLLGNAPGAAEVAAADDEPKDSVLASPIFANPRGLSAVRPSRLSRESEQHLTRLAQPLVRLAPQDAIADLNARFEDVDSPPPPPTKEELMDEVRAGRLTVKEYKAALEVAEARLRRQPSPLLGAPATAGGRISPGGAPVRRPASAPGHDRFDRELDAAAADCWEGDAVAARQYTRRLPAVGMARTVRRLKAQTVTALLNRIDSHDQSEDGVEDSSGQEAEQAQAQEQRRHHRADLEAAIGTRTTLLHVAAARGHAAVITALLGRPDKAGRPNPNGLAIVDAENEQRCTALIAAVMAAAGSSSTEEQVSEVVTALLDGGADVNARGGCGVSALQIAAADGRVSLVQTLLGAGAAVNDAWDGGATALLLAAQSGHLEVCVVLILAGADVVRADSDGLTPLLAAAMGGHEAVAVEIMRHAVARRQQAIAAN
jgi:hypothetical protein